MPQRRILFIDGNSLHVFHAVNGNVLNEERFPADAAGVERFAGYLVAHRKTIFSLLADVSEEGFHLEDIPNVGGKDRVALLQRRLGQHFYGTPYAIAESQGRIKTGRRDERLLLMALMRPQHFDPWLTALAAQQIALAGMYSVPQLIRRFVPKETTEPLLLLSLSHAGLRQSFFAERQLRFSRLTPFVTKTADEATITAILEAGKMHQYLASQRLIERNKPLTTRLLVHPAQMSVMRDRCKDSTELRFEFADLLHESARLGLRSPLADSNAEMLFCHLLAQQSPRVQFAPAPARAHYRLWQTRFGLKVASLAIIAGTLLFAIKQGVSLFNMHDTTAQILIQAQQDRQRYDVAMQLLPKVALPADKLRALTDRYKLIDKRAEGPLPLLAQLSQSLDLFPAVAIDRIEWFTSDDIAPAVAGGAGPQDAPALPPHMTSGPYAHALVAARLPIGMVGDQRGQVAHLTLGVEHRGFFMALGAVAQQFHAQVPW